ncbi:MAG: hypothetical protein ABR920_04170 [Terriglobales bacterium]
MKRLTGSMLALLVLLAVGGSGIAAGQDKSTAMMPPKVLVITREFTKPGKSGTQHEKTESLFVQATTRAKWPTHYLAVESLSGKSRALFLTGYDSFAAWEKDTLATQKNATLSAALDRAWAADGELLSETDGGAFVFREEYSLRPEVDIAHMRYFEISRFQVKQGHDKDWDEILKLVTAAYKNIPDAHWATYSAVYGFPDTTYIVFNPMKSAAEIDRNFAANKEFEAAMGEAGMKKFAELSAAAIESSQTNLFAFNPRMSYPADEWVKADPEFWKPKAAAAPAAAKKPADKPAANH